MERRRFAYRNCNAGAIPMKSATLPPLRVEPEFREKAKSVLREGETLSSFIEEAVRKQVEIRKSQAEFIARGLAALDESERTGTFYPAEEVHAELRAMLAEKKAERQK
jgi:predicted transcriptional regulator